MIIIDRLLASFFIVGLVNLRFIFAIWVINSISLSYSNSLVITNPTGSSVVVIISFMMLYILRMFHLHVMQTFEYYCAVKRHCRDEISKNLELAQREQSQLKMVLANVAHDLKTPLSAFSAGLHVIQMVCESDSRQVSLKEILDTSKDMEASAAFMSMQINRALDVSKIESNCRIGLSAKYESVSIGGVLTWSKNMVSYIQSRVRIELVCSGDLFEDNILTDKGYLRFIYCPPSLFY